MRRIDVYVNIASIGVWTNVWIFLGVLLVVVVRMDLVFDDIGIVVVCCQWCYSLVSYLEEEVGASSSFLEEGLPFRVVVASYQAIEIAKNG